MMNSIELVFHVVEDVIIDMEYYNLKEGQCKYLDNPILRALLCVTLMSSKLNNRLLLFKTTSAEELEVVYISSKIVHKFHLLLLSRYIAILFACP